MERKRLYVRPMRSRDEKQSRTIKSVAKSLEEGQLIELGISTASRNGWLERVYPVYFVGVDEETFRYSPNRLRAVGKRKYERCADVNILLNRVMSIHTI